jgi:hypothetical protein
MSDDQNGKTLNKQHEDIRLRTRLAHLLGWHTQPSDISLTDDEFVRTVFGRYCRHRSLPLIDPNE